MKVLVKRKIKHLQLLVIKELIEMIKKVFMMNILGKMIMMKKKNLKMMSWNIMENKQYILYLIFTNILEYKFLFFL